MKRFVAALVLLAVIITVSCWSLWDMKKNIDHLSQAARELQNMSLEDPSLLEKSLQFVDVWNDTESHLIFYIHHDVLDHITQQVSELPSLARYEEYGDFYARVDTLIALMDDLWNSAVPNYRNLL